MRTGVPLGSTLTTIFSKSVTGFDITTAAHHVFRAGEFQQPAARFLIAAPHRLMTLLIGML